MKKLIFLFMFLLPAVSYAAGEISNVSFYQKGNVMNVTYYSSAYKIKNVRLYINHNDTVFMIEKVFGDVGTVSGRGYKEIRFNIPHVFGSNKISGDYSFSVGGKPVEYIPMYGAYEFIYGHSVPVGFGMSVFSNWGGYARYGMSLLYISDYDKYSDSYTQNQVKKRSYRLSVTGGVIKRLTPNIYAFAGLGYGEYAPVDRVKRDYQYIEGYYYDNYYTGPKEKGLDVDLGFMFNLNGFFMSVGYTFMPGVNMPFLPNLKLGVGYAMEF